MSSVIINYLPGIENKTYLELGVFDNSNFHQIISKNKFSVDLNGNALFTGTTDQYFKSANDRFDIIFIDANHDFDFVVRDFNNSVSRCNEWILIHDMIPPGLKYIKPAKCSDSYRVLYYLLRETDFKIYPMNNNFGLTLIKMPASQIDPAESYKHISYNDFKVFISKQKLYNDHEIIQILRNDNV